MAWMTPDGAGGCVLSIWVVPSASRSELTGLHGDALRIRVAAPTENGRANRTLLTLLEELTGSRVELLSGASHRSKRVRIVDLSPEQVEGLVGVNRSS